MKHVFLMLGLSAIAVGATAQKKYTAKRTVHSANRSLNKYEREDKGDSAHIYYMQGWDAYKLNDLTTARINWERGAGCTSNIPSKYSSAFRYGLMLQNGEGGLEKNEDGAFYFYNLASANGRSEGDVDATKNVAAYYENGMSVKQDFKKALEWYLKAKAQGNKFCDADIARVRKKIAQGL